MKKQNPMELYFSTITDISEFEVEEIYKELQDTFKIIPRFYRVLATSPTLSEAYWGSYKNIILKGNLSRKVKEMLFLAIAAHKNCTYCSSIHLAICDMLEINTELLRYLISDIDEIPEENLRELVKFSIKCIDEPDNIVTDDFVNIENFDFTKDEILEVISVANYSIACINMAKVMMISVDKEIQEYLDSKTALSGLIQLR